MTTTQTEIFKSSFLGTSTGVVHTATGKTVITSAFVNNTSASDVSVTVYLASDGDGAVPSTQIITSRRIIPGETDLLQELRGQVMDAGGVLYASATVASVAVLRVSGIEIV